MIRLRIILWVVLIASFTDSLGQDDEKDYCKRTTNIKTKDIEKNYPFNTAKTIKIVSFKTKDSDAVEYEIPKLDGQVDLSRLFEIRTLTRKSRARLLDILVNYNFDTTSGDSFGVRIKMCYLPRHAILFENEEGQVFSYIEICFECLRYKIEPKDMNIGQFCYDKYDMLKVFFGDNGIKYGIGRNGMNWIEE
jgi:hypothetical protein